MTEYTRNYVKYYVVIFICFCIAIAEFCEINYRVEPVSCVKNCEMPIEHIMRSPLWPAVIG